jgi:hypothetical protein
VQEAFIYKGYLVVFSRQSLLRVYKIDKNKRVTLVQSFKAPENVFFADMEFDKTTEMLYILSMNIPQISVYHFEPSEFPTKDKTFTIFRESDTIDLSSITNKHHS